MNSTAIRLLKHLMDKSQKTADLPGLLGIKQWQILHIIKGLVGSNYVEKHGSSVWLANTPKAIAFRDAARVMDAEVLLRGSNETVLALLVNPSTAAKIAQKTGLSQITVRRCISDLRSVGAVINDDADGNDSGVMRLNESHKPLVMLAGLLSIESDRQFGDGNSIETIYRSRGVTLWKTRRGKDRNGMTTGFTLFANHGIAYIPVDDYFCRQNESLDIHDILLHAVCAAVHSKDRLELIMCVVFYAKHKDKMDVVKLRKKSDLLGVPGVWLDIESYMRHDRLANPELFLPWEEFASKAEMYDVPVENYVIPEPSDMLFEEIGRALQKPLTAYLFGGENMRIKSLKNRTKDCDMVVDSKDDFDNLKDALYRLGYHSHLKTEYADEDLRIKPDNIFLHDKKSRIDLFTSTIMRHLSLSFGMKSGAEMRSHGKLRIGLLCNEHVFLLKAIAGREGDIQDMRSLVAGNSGTDGKPRKPFEWDMVWEEILAQEEINPVKNFITTISAQILFLAEQTGIRVPIMNKLRKHTIDSLVVSLLLGGGMPVSEVVSLLTGGDITEVSIRNRINSLAKSSVVSKYPVGKTVHARLLASNEFPEPGRDMTTNRLQEYLDWRFVLRRPGATLEKTRDVADELRGMGFRTIGQLDEIIRNTVEILQRYENDQFERRYFDRVDAVRTCIGMHYDSLGDDHGSGFFVREFSRYHGMARKEYSPEFSVQRPGDA